jgi:hypothetical protein
MPVSKNAYRRFQLIDEMLQSRQFPSKELIMNYLYEEGYPISISTFEKDLEAMRSKFDLPIEYDRYKGGYCYSDPNVTLNISISSQEMEIIMLALERLKQLHKSKALLNAEKSLQRIMNRLHYNLFDWQGTSRRKITYDPLPDYSSSETLSIIYDAICEKKVLRFRLSTPDISSEEILEPYVLNEFQGKWYIAGLNDGHYGSVTFDFYCLYLSQPVYGLSCFQNLFSPYRTSTAGVFSIKYPKNRCECRNFAINSRVLSQIFRSKLCKNHVEMPESGSFRVIFPLRSAVLYN